MNWTYAAEQQPKDEGHIYPWVPAPVMPHVISVEMTFVAGAVQFPKADWQPLEIKQNESPEPHLPLLEQQGFEEGQV